MTASSSSNNAPIGTGGSPARAVVRHIGVMASQRAEELLAEVPRILRRVRTLLLVLSICVPVLVIGLIAVLWHLAS